MASLHDLYHNHHGKVADKWSLYLNVYENILASKKNNLSNFLEIGVQNGGSLEIWAKYFANATHIVGCDINKDCQKLKFNEPNIHLIVGDANDSAIQDSIVSQSQKYDVIIDDGSHTSSDIITSFCLYFPMLENDGIYIIEDLHCSYWSEFEGGLYEPKSAMNFLKKMADIINFENWGNTQNIYSLLLPFVPEEMKSIVERLDPGLLSIYSVSFYNSLCIIQKKSSENNALGKRIVVGQYADVVPDMLNLNNTRYINHTILDQQNNPWANMELAPEFDWLNQQKTNEELKNKIAQQEVVLEKKEAKINTLSNQLTNIKHEFYSFQKVKLIRLGAQLEKLRKKWFKSKI